jgi:hypothetical protein
LCRFPDPQEANPSQRFKVVGSSLASSDQQDLLLVHITDHEAGLIGLTVTTTNNLLHLPLLGLYNLDIDYICPIHVFDRTVKKLDF